MKKEKPADKRLKLFTQEVQRRILHPDYESRITIAQLLDDKEVEKVVTGRKCTGTKLKLFKGSKKAKNVPVYKVTRRFIEFSDGSRLSVGTEIFNHLKIDHKMPHEFENYYA